MMSSEPFDFDFTEDMAAIVKTQVKAVNKPPVSIYAVKTAVPSATDDAIPRPLFLQTGQPLHPEIWK
jgi:hypothetical protein